MTELEKQEIIRATHAVLQTRLQKQIPFEPRSIHEHYQSLPDSLKNYFWNEVGRISGVEHQVAYKYFINTWTRQVFDTNIKDNKDTIIPQLVAAFLAYEEYPDVQALVWQSVKPIVEANQWHLGQSYSLAHHNVKRLQKTNSQISLKSVILSGQYPPTMYYQNRQVTQHLKELMRMQPEIVRIYETKFKQKSETDDSLINVLKDLIEQSRDRETQPQEDMNFTLGEVLAILNKYE